MERQQLERFLEFALIGVVMGVIEDLLAIRLATDAAFNLHVVGVVVLVAIPFAAFSELVVDHPDFLHLGRLASAIKTALMRDR